MSLPLSSCSQIETLITKEWKDFTETKKESWSEREEIKRGLEEKLLRIISLPFKTCSTDFYDFLKTNSKIIRQEIFNIDDHVKLFFFIESYLRDKIPDSIEEIESYLKEVQAEDFDACGMGILRCPLADGVIVRNVYRSGGKDLIQLFGKYLPKPGVDLFEHDGGPIPDSIAQEAKKAEATINTLAQKHGMETLERCTIAMQRRVRGHQRRIKELLRVMEVEGCDKNEAKKRILAGNRPYMPKCKDRNLAERIFNAAYLVPNPPIIRHVTAASSFPKIMERCVYGRQFLAAHYMCFRAAQLYYDDRKNGDANAICFGPQEIDRKVWKKQSVEIVLDMEKFRDRRMERLNPCIFFKQQDLGYALEKTREVMISGDAWISFNHTDQVPCQRSRHTGCTLSLSNFQRRYAQDPFFRLQEVSSNYAQVPFQQLISSNFESMTAIQTLNFFRYVDSLAYSIDEIYDKIAQLDDKQLVDFLVQLHDRATDTAEFNFYGAYRIDPELIKSIRYVPNGESPVGSFSVRLSQLIDRLNEGDLAFYQEVKEKMPFLFESKRFMNFLSSKVKNPEVLGGS